MQDLPPTAAAHPDPWRVEAARYALLRRLAFAMRHHMVVHLQPIGMITEVMDRRLRRPDPDVGQVRDSMGRIHGFSRAAVQSCLEVVGWLAPDPQAGTTLAAGLQECLSMLRSNLSFRGFTVRDEVSDGETVVSQSALRAVFPAALLTLSDGTAGPALLRVEAHATPRGAEVTLSVSAGDGTPGFAADALYRVLDWDEVEALAQAEQVELRRDGDGVRLGFAAPAPR